MVVPGEPAKGNDCMEKLTETQDSATKRLRDCRLGCRVSYQQDCMNECKYRTSSVLQSPSRRDSD